MKFETRLVLILISPKDDFQVTRVCILVAMVPYMQLLSCVIHLTPSFAFNVTTCVHLKKQNQCHIEAPISTSL